MERTDKLNQLRQFNRPWEYDCCDIAEKLVELSNLPDDGQLKNELTDALYYLKAVAENPYNSDYHRVLFNVLLVITDRKSTRLNSSHTRPSRMPSSA